MSERVVKLMTLTYQLLAKFDVVEDLAVESDPQRAISDGHRLPAAFEVDDAQASMGQPDSANNGNAAIIRAAVGQGCNHFGKFVSVYGCATELSYSRYAAHKVVSYYESLMRDLKLRPTVH